MAISIQSHTDEFKKKTSYCMSVRLLPVNQKLTGRKRKEEIGNGWNWTKFRLQIGSFFMINLCLVVIATQFSETKKREMERMRLERARFHSTSTLASSTNTSEPTTCYAEIVKWVYLKKCISFSIPAWRYQGNKTEVNVAET